MLPDPSKTASFSRRISINMLDDESFTDKIFKKRKMKLLILV
jgi:hypothetical protein